MHGQVRAPTTKQLPHCRCSSSGHLANTYAWPSPTRKQQQQQQCYICMAAQQQQQHCSCSPSAGRILGHLAYCPQQLPTSTHTHTHENKQQSCTSRQTQKTGAIVSHFCFRSKLKSPSWRLTSGGSFDLCPCIQQTQHRHRHTNTQNGETLNAQYAGIHAQHTTHTDNTQNGETLNTQHSTRRHCSLSWCHGVSSAQHRQTTHRHRQNGEPITLNTQAVCSVCTVQAVCSAQLTCRGWRSSRFAGAGWACPSRTRSSPPTGRPPRSARSSLQTTTHTNTKTTQTTSHAHIQPQQTARIFTQRKFTAHKTTQTHDANIQPKQDEASIQARQGRTHCTRNETSLQARVNSG